MIAAWFSSICEARSSLLRLRSDLPSPSASTPMVWLACSFCRLARELAHYGIRVMALAPGTFETGMYEVVPDHTRRTLIEDVPFPRRPGRPAEFAHMAKALIENSMMNGSVVRIDGAVRMREPQAPNAGAGR